MNAVRFTITGELLADLLCLPEGSTLIRARHVTESPHACDIEFVVTSPDLPEVKEGNIIPQVNPQYSRIDDKTVFESWGFQKDTATNRNVLKAKEAAAAILGIQQESLT